MQKQEAPLATPAFSDYKDYHSFGLIAGFPLNALPAPRSIATENTALETKEALKSKGWMLFVARKSTLCMQSIPHFEYSKNLCKNRERKESRTTMNSKKQSSMSFKLPFCTLGTQKAKQRH